MKLGVYKGLKVTGPDLTVSEKELQRAITNMQRKNAVFIHIDHRPAAAGDAVVLNYEGFIDGKPFAGGKATHHRLVLGEGKFIPGFEEQIAGRTMGDMFEMPVVFPAGYANRELAGKPAVFQTELLFVGQEEMPEFDDDFAQDFSSFSTADELKSSIELSLRAKREAAEQERIQEELLTQIIEASEVPISEAVLEELTEEVFAEKLEDIEAQGMTLEEFLKRSRRTLEDIQYQCRKKARRNYLETAVLHEIAMKENMVITGEELEKAVWELAFYEELDPMMLFETMDEEELTGIKLQLYCDKAMELVRETAIYI